MSPILRQVDLPAGVRGALFISSIPGRDGPIERALEEMRERGIDRIICLLPDDEIRMKSPPYAAALRDGGLPCPVQRFPIPDFGVPENREAFLSLVGQMADSMRSGQRLLVHCAAGFGRAGTAATCALVALGVEADAARGAVERAGGRAEHDLVHWLV